MLARAILLLTDEEANGTKWKGRTAMCGITALFRELWVELPPGTVARMTEAVHHRGPDDAGMILLSPTPPGAWQPCSVDEPQWRLALGARRLSILDVSQAGHMPMGYQGKYWLVYNGEVYNFLELRHELEASGHSFRSNSDTEVILAAYAEWGTSSFARFRGMWHWCSLTWSAAGSSSVATG